VPSHKDKVFEKWWPLAHSLILVRASVIKTAAALEAQFKIWDRMHLRGWMRWSRRTKFGWEQVSSVDSLFRNVDGFTSFGTAYYALPTFGPWTVIWDNSSRCHFHDSLNHCLTQNQNLETLSFYSTDRNSIQLAGTSFTYLWPRPGQDFARERNVYCCNQGKRWHFEQHGEPLAEEDSSLYSLKRKRERMNEESLMWLLDKLDARPWREDYYDFRNAKSFRVTCWSNPRLQPPVDFEQIRVRALGSHLPEQGDEEKAEVEIKGPPSYLVNRCKPATENGPARLIDKSDWCRRTGQESKFFDIHYQGCDRFLLRLPFPPSEMSVNPALVNAICESTGEEFAIFDIRKVIASGFFGDEAVPELQPPVNCPKCGGNVFRASVGFGIHSESDSADDTTWFALAVRCVHCSWGGVIYEHEGK